VLLQAVLLSGSRSAVPIARGLAVSFALSVLMSGPARGGEDRADKLHPLAVELSKAVEELSKPGTSAEGRAKAAETIARLGHAIQSEGPHILVPALQDRREVVRIKAARTLHEFGPTVAYDAVRFHWLFRDHKAHLDPSPAVRAEIVSVMVLVGRAEPKLVLPALGQILSEDKSLELRLRAAAGLVRIILGLGPAPANSPVEDLIPQEIVQKYSVFLPVLRETNKALRAALKDSDEQVRLKALKALNELGLTQEPFHLELTQVPVRQLLDVLREKNPAIRVEAVAALGTLNRQRPRQVEPALIEALKDESKAVRLRAVVAVSSVPPVDLSGVRALIEALKENDAHDVAGFSVCRSAAWALARMGPTVAREAIPAAVGWLDSTDVRLQSDAIQLLQAVGSADERVAPALRKVLTHKHRGVRVYAASCLSKLGGAYYKETLPVLLDGFDIRDIKDQSMGSEADGRLLFVARALGEMGLYAEEAVPKLRAILNDPKRQVVHNEVKKALQKIRP
jgi:HEAT repeat protein